MAGSAAQMAGSGLARCSFMAGARLGYKHSGGPAHGGRLGARAQRGRDRLRLGLVGPCCARALRRRARSLDSTAVRIPRATAGA